MKQFHLHYTTILQGDFQLHAYNLLFVFQVNCPGCFFYGIPLMNSLLQNPKNKAINFLGLSTAFEDFDFNTLAHTSNLIENGEMVGETYKAFQLQAYQKYPHTLNFPVAMDERSSSTHTLDTVALTICQDHPTYRNAPANARETLYKNVLHYLKNQESVSLTFTSNQLKGTPSFILFTDKMEILAQWFGHKKETEIQKLLDKIRS